MSTRTLKHEFEAQLAEGNFVKVAGAESQAEAEFLQGLLREEECPRRCAERAALTFPH